MSQTHLIMRKHKEEEKMKEITLNKGNVLDLLDCINVWIAEYGYENMRPEMKELTSNLLTISQEFGKEGE